MSKILFVCPTHRDYREIERLGLDQRHRFFFHDYASLLLEELVAAERPASAVVDDVRTEIQRLRAHYAAAGLDAVVSSDDYPGSTLASILAHALGLPGLDPRVNLRCQHKYYSRLDQRQHVPDAVPPFHLLDEHGLPSPRALRYPVFLKPVKSFFSVGARRVDTAEDLLRDAWDASLFEPFFQPFESLLADYAGLALGPRVIVEGLLEGMQVTVEGYAQGGEIRVIGVVDSIMYPGTRSFQRFEYPSALPDSVQERMADIACKFVRGIGYDNALFNIEMMYDARTDAIHIIEINPRIASQFADLYEKVDGTNTYEVLLDLALGRRPAFRRRSGKHRFAASCVLRTFENATVAALPSAAEVARVQRLHPDVRVEILATQGRRLSQEMQDGESYRYGIISIGGRDREDILATLAECRSHLTFGLAPIEEAPHRARAVVGG
ncbi:MAG: acetyl-CoA carboxylase biotin carboxylase subunit family protein [Sulfurifustaceae bacterium]